MTTAESTFHELRIEFAREGLPVDVISSVMRAIGTVYPGAQLGPSPAFGGMSILIPRDARPRRGIKKKLVADPAEDGEDGFLATNVGSDGVGFTLPVHVANALLPILRTSFEQYPDATNYLEMPVLDKSDGARYLLTFARSQGQTPHALRQAAERRYDKLLADLESLAPHTPELSALIARATAMR